MSQAPGGEAGFPVLTAAAGPSARRRPFAQRSFRVLSPYLLLAPAALVIGAVLAYPVYMLARLWFLVVTGTARSEPPRNVGMNLPLM